MTSLYELNPLVTALDRADAKHLHAVDDETFHSPLLRFVRGAEELVEKPAVILFRYSPGANLIEEPVYNTDVIWPDDAPVIRAHDRGDKQNVRLFEYYAQRSPDRAVYRYDRGTAKMTRLGTVQELAGATIIPPP